MQHAKQIECTTIRCGTDFEIRFYSKFAVSVRHKGVLYISKEGDKEALELIGIQCYQAAEKMGVELPGATPQLRQEWAKYKNVRVTSVRVEDVTDKTMVFFDFPLGVRTHDRPWSLAEIVFEFTWTAGDGSSRQQAMWHDFMGVPEQ
jgi:hypothetical protein